MYAVAVMFPVVPFIFCVVKNKIFTGTNVNLDFYVRRVAKQAKRSPTFFVRCTNLFLYMLKLLLLPFYYLTCTLELLMQH